MIFTIIQDDSKFIGRVESPSSFAKNAPIGRQLLKELWGKYINGLVDCDTASFQSWLIKHHGFIGLPDDSNDIYLNVNFSTPKSKLLEERILGFTEFKEAFVLADDIFEFVKLNFPKFKVNYNGRLKSFVEDEVYSTISFDYEFNIRGISCFLNLKFSFSDKMPYSPSKKIIADMSYSFTEGLFAKQLFNRYVATTSELKDNIKRNLSEYLT